MIDWTALAPALGPTLGVVVVVVLFLRHITEQAKLTRETVADFRSEQRAIVASLVALNRETVAAIDGIGARMDGLGREVAALGGRVDDLGGAITKLADSNGHGEAHPGAAQTPRQA